ncbi:TonB-dependent receptor domain-containing protein [Kordiimonas lacus]|uniref:Iron complex outermembrane recepter protein n=1 Tax=Kordiimonas lacus TaxID=637679 RepID=A0A1G6USG4_9PROT|nr:TonB-dependent receptor [Kordiimonas lacus]SDD43656.1 iron complex outermembrane recepter protein [Kordiimonas lacus]
MNSTELLKNRLAFSTASLLIATAGMMGTPGAMAQDTAGSGPQCAADQVIGDDGECVFEDELVEVVVTGSRIRRSEFTSASPIQIISGQKSREIGLISAADVLQSTVQTSGLQIDNTFGGFVIDNGPGSQQIGLRGLDPERTLVVLNGRRLAPAGIGGAPTSPDLNLIPSIMVDQYDILLDGASTIYGSDAIAGVVNIKLRQDVEGFEVDASYQVPFAGGAEELTASVLWGTKTDRASFMIGAEFYDRKAQTVGENPYMGDCEGYEYEDAQGNRYQGDRTLGPESRGIVDCNIFPLTNRMSIPIFWGSVYYTPGFSNTGIPGVSDGIPNFSESSVTGFAGFFPHWVAADSNANGDLTDDNGYAIVDWDGDGLKDFDFQDPFYAFDRSEYAQQSQFISPSQRVTIMGTADYNLQDENDTTFYFEGLYSQRDDSSFAAGYQLFPTVGADNPYNPCGVDGVDCLGVIGFPIGPTSVTPIVNIRGDRDTANFDLYQYRLVGGVRGNISALDNFGQGNWSYDAYGSYSYSKGSNSRFGISNPRLEQSLDATRDANGNPVCNDTSNGCVPVNLFGDNIFQEGGGTFTDAEADFLMVERYSETIVKQTMASAFLTGDLFRLPWNDTVVPIVFGYEFRRDTIASNPNDVAADGLLFGWFADSGADGSRDLHEFYAETHLDLLQGLPFAEELSIDASARWTDESYYSPASTYSVKGVYRPVEYLTFRGSYGTSYRAPNLREHFLNGTTGFNSVSDPCVVPEAARANAPGGQPGDPQIYNAADDTRLDRVLDACRADGVDPTTLGLNPATFGSYSVEIITGGALDLTEEESTSKTVGVVLDQPWFDNFDLRLAVTYFDIEITGSIEEPTRGFIVNRCYDNPDEPNATSGFCSRITRDSDGFIDLLDTSFVNAGRYTSKGFDFNLYYQQDFEVGSKTLGVSFDLRATNQRENEFELFGDLDDFAGEPGSPHWRARGLLTLEYDDFAFNWDARWIQGGENDNPEDFDTTAIPCDGLGVGCRPVYYTDNYMRHNMSIGWNNGKYRVNVGVENVFNAKPPRVDADGVFSIRNVPIGIGHDVIGRSVFMSVGATF